MTEPTSTPASNNRGVMIVLSYLWLLALIPLLVEKEDKDVQWHAKNGIVLMVAEFVFWVVFWTLSIPLLGFGCFGWMLVPVINLAILGLHIYAIIKGLNNQRLVVPVLSDFVSKF
jgi:uncharacterized membrane protein